MEEQMRYREEEQRRHDEMMRRDEEMRQRQMERIRGGSGGQFGGGDRPKPEAEETESPRDAVSQLVKGLACRLMTTSDDDGNLQKTRMVV